MGSVVGGLYLSVLPVYVGGGGKCNKEFIKEVIYIFHIRKHACFPKQGEAGNIPFDILMHL